MQPPEDPLAPVGHCFAEPWHALILATAHELIRAGHLAQADWADALGAALQKADTAGQPDTEETYYLAALDALESVAPFDADELACRKADWESAYRRTPHGQPVVLRADA